MLLNEDQEKLLENFEAHYNRQKNMRETLLAEAIGEIDRKVAEARKLAVQAGQAAVQAGVPIAHLGRKDRAGMRTLNRATIKRFIELDEKPAAPRSEPTAPPTADPTQAPMPSAVPGVHVERQHDGTIRVELSAPELTERLAQRGGHNSIESTGAEYRSAVFEEVAPGAWVPTGDEIDEHGLSNLVHVWYGAPENRQKVKEAVSGE